MAKSPLTLTEEDYVCQTIFENHEVQFDHYERGIGQHTVKIGTLVDKYGRDGLVWVQPLGYDDSEMIVSTKRLETIEERDERVAKKQAEIEEAEKRRLAKLAKEAEEKRKKDKEYQEYLRLKQKFEPKGIKTVGV